MPKASWVERSLEYNTPLWHRNKKRSKRSLSKSFIQILKSKPVEVVDVSWCFDPLEWKKLLFLWEKRHGPTVTNFQIFDFLWSNTFHQWYFASEQFVVQRNWHGKTLRWVEGRAFTSKHWCWGAMMHFPTKWGNPQEPCCLLFFSSLGDFTRNSFATHFYQVSLESFFVVYIILCAYIPSNAPPPSSSGQWWFS